MVNNEQHGKQWWWAHICSSWVAFGTFFICNITDNCVLLDNRPFNCQRKTKNSRWQTINCLYGLLLCQFLRMTWQLSSYIWNFLTIMAFAKKFLFLHCGLNREQTINEGWCFLICKWKWLAMVQTKTCKQKLSRSHFLFAHSCLRHWLVAFKIVVSHVYLYNPTIWISDVFAWVAFLAFRKDLDCCILGHICIFRMDGRQFL